MRHDIFKQRMLRMCTVFFFYGMDPRVKGVSVSVSVSVKIVRSVVIVALNLPTGAS